MNSSSPTTLMFTGMIVAAFSIKLKTDYRYLSYIAILVGLIIFIMGIVKYIQQRNG